MEENDFIVIFKQGRSNMSKAKKIIIFVALLDILVVCGIEMCIRDRNTIEKIFFANFQNLETKK